MKKIVFAILFAPIASFGQIPTIDPTAIQRLVELKNTVANLKKGLVLQKNTDNNTLGAEANTTGLLEAQTKIEDILRDSDEFVRLAYQNTSLADISNLVTFSKNLKGSFLGNLNSHAWKLQDLKAYLEGNQYSQNSGAEMYDILTKGFSLDNKMGTNTISTYYDRINQFYNRQYALQTALQKKKMQQALTYYKMADELEAKAQVISEGIKSQQAGKPFTLQNKGVFGLAKSGVGGLLDDAFSASEISIPSFTNIPLVVAGKTYVMDTQGNVYDAQGSFITNDIGFGVAEQAQAAYEQDKANSGLLGKIFGAKPEDYIAQVIKQRESSRNQSIATATQNEIYNNILKNAVSGKEGEYASLFNGVGALGGMIATKSGLRMSTGERIESNKMVIDLMTKAQEMRDKADGLLMEALQRTQEQKQLEAVWQKNMIRKSLTKMTL